MPVLKTLSRSSVPLAFLGMIGLMGCLSGCADVGRVLSLDPGGVDPASPVARTAVAASRGRYRMPRFSEIPALPKDLIPAPVIKRDVGDLVAERRALAARTAALPAGQTDTDGFAARTRDPLLARDLTPPPADQDARTAAFVEQMRGMSAPPASSHALDKAPQVAAPPVKPQGD